MKRLSQGLTGALRPLVIAGGGPLESEVAAWAANQPSVQMTGTLSSDKCAEVISAARAVLLPSAWEETFGLVAVEAMAAGVPPIALQNVLFACTMWACMCAKVSCAGVGL